MYELIGLWGHNDYQAEITYPTSLSYNGKLDTVIVFGSDKELKPYSSGIRPSNVIFSRYSLKITFTFYDEGGRSTFYQGNVKMTTPQGAYFFTKIFAKKNWAIYVRAVRLYKIKLVQDKIKADEDFSEKYFPDGK